MLPPMGRQSVVQHVFYHTIITTAPSYPLCSSNHWRFEGHQQAHSLLTQAHTDKDLLVFPKHHLQDMHCTLLATALYFLLTKIHHCLSQHLKQSSNEYLQLREAACVVGHILIVTLRCCKGGEMGGRLQTGGIETRVCQHPEVGAVQDPLRLHILPG